MQVNMTGKEDREGPWKFAIAGPAGSGKTMISSTAPDPLFVFFQQEPRIKSVANRSIQYVKVLNDFPSQVFALDQMSALLTFLTVEDHKFKTFVMDTGDEFFQLMKLGRAHQNGGEFGVGDWGWISDAYRSVILGIIDLPMNVIVTFHVKSAQDEERSFKELMLQGQAKDEAPGWFDIVGALDTYEIIDEQGETVTKRVLLTSSSRTYPWVKDHSGAIPRRFELSPSITDDIPRLLALAGAEIGTASREVVSQIAPPPVLASGSDVSVPSPEDLEAKKKGPREDGPKPAVLDSTEAAREKEKEEEEAKARKKARAATAARKKAAAAKESQKAKDAEVEEAEIAERAEKAQAKEAEEAKAIEESKAKELKEEAEAAREESDVAVEAILGGEEVFLCSVCGVEVGDEDLRDLTQIRFREYICRPHFKEKLAR